MREIDEGLWHWTATHPRINWEVSYYLSDARALIDPVLPELDFDRLLLAHGQPITVGGKQALTAFVGG